VFSWSLIFCPVMWFVKICRRYWIQWKNHKVRGGEKYSVTRERAADETEEWAAGAAGTYGRHWRSQCYGHWGFSLQVKWCSKLLYRLYFRECHVPYRWLVIQKIMWCKIHYYN
jgi:hypothetical protein